MMRFYFQKKVLFGFFAALGIITWLGISSYMNSVKLKKTLAGVAHTNEVMFHGQRVLAIIIDIESGQRGYIITGDSSFLQSQIDGVSVVNTHLDDLQRLTADNESQLERIAELRAVILKKIEFTERSIKERNKNAAGATEMIATEEGKKLMDQIRMLLRALQQEEKILLEQRTTLSEHDMLSFYYAFIALLAATAIILMVVFVTLHATMRKRAEADASVREAMAQVKDMYDNAPCGYHSLDKEGYFLEINKTELDLLGYTHDEVVGNMKFQDILVIEERKKFEESFPKTQIHGAIHDVETRVRRKDGTIFPVILSASMVYDTKGNFVKTRSMLFDYTDRRQAEDKILQLNHELEAFTYSVSHDLRAPLRSIDGYARILAEDYVNQLDDEGKRILNIVVRNAARMGLLIDDLLNFSRVGRKDLSKANYVPETMIKSVCDELLENEKGRNVEFVMGKIEPSYSDPSLMRQVWYNLISNALKYSKNKDKTLVEITSQIQGQEVIYCIRDNGTGFDMQYAHKLFTVFQRLHKSQDFEGTGVGLAIVQRIVSRHGGRVWAEGEVDRGAAFYFTIPLDQKA